MRVRMLTTAAGPDGTYHVGETWNVPQDDGVGLVVGGYATALDPVVPVPTTMPPVETTLAPPAPERRRGTRHA